MLFYKPPKKLFISRIPWFVIGARVWLLIIKVIYSALLRPVKNTYGLSAVIALSRSCVGSASICQMCHVGQGSEYHVTEHVTEHV